MKICSFYGGGVFLGPLHLIIACPTHTCQVQTDSPNVETTLRAPLSQSTSRVLSIPLLRLPDLLPGPEGPPPQSTRPLPGPQGPCPALLEEETALCTGTETLHLSYQEVQVHPPQQGALAAVVAPHGALKQGSDPVRQAGLRKGGVHLSTVHPAGQRCFPWSSLTLSPHRWRRGGEASLDRLWLGNLLTLQPLCLARPYQLIQCGAGSLEVSKRIWRGGGGEHTAAFCLFLCFS